MTKPIWYFSVMGSNRGDQAIREGVTSHLRKYTDAPIAFFSCKTDLLNKQRIDQLNKEGSMLLIAGSGLYSNYDLESGFYFRCNPEDFKHIEVPIVLLSLGMNNHLEMDRFTSLSPQTLTSIKTVNEQAVHTSVRDYRTLRMLHGMGVEKAMFVPDPAMFCHSEEAPFQLRNKRLVGLSIAQHAKMLKKHRENVIRVFIELCHALDDGGYTPIFISHDALEHNIYEELKQGYPRLLYYNEDSPRGMMGVYEKCVFSVGIRCHSNIMSFGANTPFIALAYDEKQVEFCKIAGTKPLLLTQGLAVEALLNRVKYIEENYMSIKKDMSDRWNYLYSVFDTTLNKIAEEVK